MHCLFSRASRKLKNQRSFQLNSTCRHLLTCLPCLKCCNDIFLRNSECFPLSVCVCVCVRVFHFVIGTANKCDGINNAKVFILTSNRQSCALPGRIHLSPARSGTGKSYRRVNWQWRWRRRRRRLQLSRMSCILCYFATKSTSFSSCPSSSCALLKLCAVLAPVLAGPRRIHVAKGAALEMSMLPIAVHKVLPQLVRGRQPATPAAAPVATSLAAAFSASQPVPAELCSYANVANGIHYWMQWRPP